MKYTFLLLVILSSFSLLGQDIKECSQLRFHHLNYSKNLESSELANLYVSNFPSNFECFYKIFSNKNGCIKDSAFYYVRTFRKTRSIIGEEMYFDKLFKVSKGGFYEVDGISALQNLNHYLLKSKKRDTYLAFLDKQKNSDLKQYFKFVFDILKSSLFYDDVRLDEIKSTYPKLYKQMKFYF